MLTVGENTIQSLFIKTMGIKTATVGSQVIYNRPGGYCYIELSTSEEKEK